MVVGRRRNRRRRGALAALLVAWSLAGCNTVEVETGLSEGQSREYTAHRWLWGIVGADIEADDKPIASFEVEQAFSDLFLTLLTAGIYCPATVTVWFVD